MEQKTCELCGREAEPGTLKKHQVVPRQVREQAGVRRSKIARICPACSAELNKWYSVKVLDRTYDTRTKMFIAKPPLDMVKEYEAAYRIFARYKKER